MARPKNTLAPLSAPALIGPNEAAEMDARAAQAGEMLEAEALFAQMVERGGGQALIAVGRIQAATVSAALSDSMVIDAYEKVASSRSYVGIPYFAEDGSRKRVSALDEFCEVFLGRGARRCRQLVANRRLIGEELYEAAQAIGFRQQDYNALKALPADDQEAVKQALAEEDKDRALEVLSGLVARAAEHKAQAEQKAEAAEARAEEIEKDYDTVSTMYGKAKTEITRLKAGGEIPGLDKQMAGWPAVTGLLTGEIRSHLTRVLMVIEEAERRIFDANPQEGTPAVDVVERAATCLYRALGPDLALLEDELSLVRNRLERVVGAFAERGVEALPPQIPQA